MNESTENTSNKPYRARENILDYSARISSALSHQSLQAGKADQTIKNELFCTIAAWVEELVKLRGSGEKASEQVTAHIDLMTIEAELACNDITIGARDYGLVLSQMQHIYLTKNGHKYKFYNIVGSYMERIFGQEPLAAFQSYQVSDSFVLYVYAYPPS
jgi:hypothetical protein